MRNRSTRRGNVSIEYVLLVSLIAGVAMVQVAIPDAIGGLLLRASDNMGHPSEHVDGGPTFGTPSTPDDGDDGVVDELPPSQPEDPWTEGPGSGVDDEPTDDTTPPEVTPEDPDALPPTDPPVTPGSSDPEPLPPTDPPEVPGSSNPEPTPPTDPPAGPTDAAPPAGGGGGGGGITPPADPPPYVDPFDPTPGGGITTTTDTDPDVMVLGSAITYGAGGAQVPVRLEVIVNGVARTVFYGTGSQIDDSDMLDLLTVPEGTDVEFRGTSYNQNGSKLYQRSTITGSPMILVLRNGDSVPDKTPFGQQPTIKSFLSEVIDPATGLVTIGENEVLYLMELGTNDVRSSAADFQDLVFKVTFTSPTQTVGGGGGTGTSAP